MLRMDVGQCTFPLPVLRSLPLGLTQRPADAPTGPGTIGPWCVPCALSPFCLLPPRGSSQGTGTCCSVCFAPSPTSPAMGTSAQGLRPQEGRPWPSHSSPPRTCPLPCVTPGTPAHGRRGPSLPDVTSSREPTCGSRGPSLRVSPPPERPPMGGEPFLTGVTSSRAPAHGRRGPSSLCVTSSRAPTHRRGQGPRTCRSWGIWGMTAPTRSGDRAALTSLPDPELSHDLPCWGPVSQAQGPPYPMHPAPESQMLRGVPEQRWCPGVRDAGGRRGCPGLETLMSLEALRSRQWPLLWVGVLGVPGVHPGVRAALAL